jgi:hypothetical protein
MLVFPSPQFDSSGQIVPAPSWPQRKREAFTHAMRNSLRFGWAIWSVAPFGPRAEAKALQHAIGAQTQALRLVPLRAGG